MKIKISKSKAGETRIDYLRIKDKAQFRFRLMKKLTEAFGNDAAILVDTNLRVEKRSGTEMLERLRQAGYEPSGMRIQADSEHFFGMRVDFWTKNDIEYLIYLELQGKPFSEELSDIFAGHDISLGLKQKEPAVDRLNLAAVNSALMLKTCFENRIYDSVICSRINSDFDISRYVEEVLNEMGI